MRDAVAFEDSDQEIANRRRLARLAARNLRLPDDADQASSNRGEDEPGCNHSGAMAANELASTCRGALRLRGDGLMREMPLDVVAQRQH